MSVSARALAGTARRHSGGSIRQRPSGRWQVRVHIYQHASEDADQAIADALGDVITKANVLPFARVIEQTGVQRLGD